MTRPPSPRLYCRFPDWPRRFDDPIPLPGGRQLVTLTDAADYILALPAKTSAQEHWQLAMQMLIDVLRALIHGRPDPANTPRSKRAKAYRVLK
ncbi:hypothetical protein [Bradyrhizobium sp. AZCC 2289]|uniref:hypothetical protein n=1 Tax=Bradyrhizobium sp. AZCC 2289 TaxID=3117026 RepID=UPI002FF19BF1